MRTSSRALPVALCAVACAFCAGPVAGQVDVLTQHNDNARSGANLQETTLTPANVNNQHFGKLAFRIVDGNIYAQPLIVAQAKIANRPSPVNAIIVATEHNSVYAFDADNTDPASTKAQLWHSGDNVLGVHIESTELNQVIHAPGCSDLTTEIGITGTPAIALSKQSAPKEGFIFVVGKSKSAGKHIYKLFALNLSDGQKAGEILIEGDVKGTGAGSTGTGANKRIRFDPSIQLNRPALLLLDGVLYIAFGGHCDQRNYHGWLFAYDVSNPRAPKKLDVFCVTPNGTGSPVEGRAGVWMSGEGPAADDAGNVYFATGDGSNNGTTDLGDSAIKIKLTAGKFQVQDWFAPQNQAMLKNQDVDLGSGGAVPLPNSHLLLAGGKEGRLYLIDRDNMGKGVTPALDSFQVTHGPNPPVFYNLHGAPVIWARQGHMFVYINGEEDPLKQYKLIPDAGTGWKFESHAPFAASAVSAPYPNFPTGMFGQTSRDPVWMPGGFLSLSADGANDGTGIVWVNMPFAASANHAVVRGVLRAFDAADVSRPQLWDSESTGNQNDRLGQFAKFCPPLVANGKVYVAAFQEEMIGNDGVHRKRLDGDQPALVIYGLK